MVSQKEATVSQVFQGRRFLITSGPIRAPIDAVRFISSTSTGKLGSLMALEALRRGAQVTFLFGEGSALPELAEAELRDRFAGRPVGTYDDLMRAFGRELGSGGYDVVIHAMAVLDYVPEKPLARKMTSGKDHWIITLVPTPKLIEMIKRWNPGVFLVGFKLEVGLDQDGLVGAAGRSMEKNKADLVVANELTMIQRGKHRALVVGPGGKVEAALEGKEEIARGVMELIAAKLKGRK